jgi:hypothetical protein
MPLLAAVLERFVTASQDHADQDLAAIYEVGGPGKPCIEPNAAAHVCGDRVGRVGYGRGLAPTLRAPGDR